MIKYGIENINVGFGLTYLPSEYLTQASSENYPNNIMSNIATIHISVVMYQYYCNPPSKPHNSSNPEKTDELIQQLAIASSGFHNTHFI